MLLVLVCLAALAVPASAQAAHGQDESDGPGFVILAGPVAAAFSAGGVGSAPLGSGTGGGYHVSLGYGASPHQQFIVSGSRTFVGGGTAAELGTVAFGARYVIFPGETLTPVVSAGLLLASARLEDGQPEPLVWGGGGGELGAGLLLSLSRAVALDAHAELTMAMFTTARRGLDERDPLQGPFVGVARIGVGLYVNP